MLRVALTMTDKDIVSKYLLKRIAADIARILFHLDIVEYEYRLLDMHTVDYRALLEQNTPDALALAILCDFHGAQERDVVRDILNRLRKVTGENETVFRDYLLMLEILSTNRDLRQILQEEEAMLSDVKYSDLPSYGLGMQKGMEKGIEKGMEKGMEKGEAKIVKYLLSQRFGELSEAVQQRLDAASSVELETWAGRVLNAKTLPEVFH